MIPKLVCLHKIPKLVHLQHKELYIYTRTFHGLLHEKDRRRCHGKRQHGRKQQFALSDMNIFATFRYLIALCITESHGIFFGVWLKTWNCTNLFQPDAFVRVGWGI